MKSLVVAGFALLTMFSGEAYSQTASADEAAGVAAANNAYYAGLSALDLVGIEKAWAHESYVALAGPRSSAPIIGWSVIQPFYAKLVESVAEISVKPIDVHTRITGNSAWTISREEVGNTSRWKNGTPMSSRPTIATNMFEKIGGKWVMVAHHAQEIPQ